MGKTSLLAVACLAALVLPAGAQAYWHKAANIVVLPAGETVEGNFYAAGSSVTIDGDVNGDVFLAGQNISVNGRVSGDVFAVGENIVLNGDIGSSLRAAGANIAINSRVSGSALGLGASLTLAKDAAVGGDFLFAGALGRFLGDIGLDLHGGGANVHIAGQVGRDVKLRLGKSGANGGLKVDGTAKIGGNLYYSAPAEGDISGEAVIAGKTGYSPSGKQLIRSRAWDQAWSGLVSVFGLYVTGLVLISLWRRELKGINAAMLDKPLASIGAGALILPAVPLGAALLLFTIIGIPLALILLFAWLTAVYLSKVIAGLLIGASLLERFGGKRKESMIYALVLGVPAVSLACSLPLIGWLIALLTAAWSLGGLWRHFRGAGALPALPNK